MRPSTFARRVCVLLLCSLAAGSAPAATRQLSIDCPMMKGATLMAIRHVLAVSFFCLLWLGNSGAIAEEHHHEHSAMSLDQYIARLEDPKRDEWQKPDEVLRVLNLQEGQVVAEIGSGSGYFTVRLAQTLAPLKGRVMALDVDEGMVTYLRKRLTQEQIKNVTVVQAPAHDPLLIDQSADVVFICDTYHHIEDRDIYMRKVRKGLKPNGRLVIVDFYKRVQPFLF